MLSAFGGQAALGADSAEARLGEHDAFTRAVIITEHPVDIRCDISEDGRTAILHFDRALAIKHGAMIRSRRASFDNIGADPQDSVQIQFRLPMRLAFKNVFPGPAGGESRAALDFYPREAPAETAGASPASPPAAQPSPPAAAARSSSVAAGPVPPAVPPARQSPTVRSAVPIEAVLGVPMPAFGTGRSDILAGIRQQFGADKAVVEMSGRSPAEEGTWVMMMEAETPSLGPAQVMYFLRSSKEGFYQADMVFGGALHDPVEKVIERRRELDRLLGGAGFYPLNRHGSDDATDAAPWQYIDDAQRVASVTIRPVPGVDERTASYALYLVVAGQPSR